MRSLRLVIPILFAFILVGCGKDITMPDVTGKKLDVAYDKMKGTGLDDKDKIDVEGGGLFGIVRESNWTVCKQSPAAGKVVTGETKLTVKRSCKKKSEKDDDKVTNEATPSPSPTPPKSPTPKTPDVLTAKNNKEFAALLKIGDDCSDKIDNFAKSHPRQQLRFDGSISAFAGHEGYKTRFDMLIGAGDRGGNTSSGPNFQFYDKNAGDLNLTGNYPDNLAVGQKYTFTAEVEEYDANSCLLKLDPVETKVR